jgi:hypothetical protein
MENGAISALFRSFRGRFTANRRGALTRSTTFDAIPIAVDTHSHHTLVFNLCVRRVSARILI